MIALRSTPEPVIQNNIDPERQAPQPDFFEKPQHTREGWPKRVRRRVLSEEASHPFVWREPDGVAFNLQPPRQRGLASADVAVDEMRGCHAAQLTQWSGSRRLRYGSSRPKGDSPPLPSRQSSTGSASALQAEPLGDDGPGGVTKLPVGSGFAAPGAIRVWSRARLTGEKRTVASVRVF